MPEMEVRCKKCGKKLGDKLEGTIEIVCPRCGVFNKFASGYNSHLLATLNNNRAKSF